MRRGIEWGWKWLVQRRRRIEKMVAMTIQIPDDVARGLEGVAAAQHKSVEELAVERLRSLLERPTSPEAVLQAIRLLPHPSPGAVDDLEAVIAASRLPVREAGLFDGSTE